MEECLRVLEETRNIILFENFLIMIHSAKKSCLIQKHQRSLSNVGKEAFQSLYDMIKGIHKHEVSIERKMLAKK